MKRIQQGVWLAGLLALAACTSTGTDMASTDSASHSSGSSGDTGSRISDSRTAGTATGGTGNTGSSTAGMASDTTASDGSGSMQASGSNSTVTSVEVLPRQSDSSGAVGSSSGATATTTASDRLYRITLRMDDGQTQVITQDWAPAVSSGDRVRVVSGAIQR